MQVKIFTANVSTFTYNCVSKGVPVQAMKPYEGVKTYLPAY
jgi:hypothetical protein